MISLLCPTRNRPEGVRRLMDSAMAHAEGSIEFVFYCDDDAPITGDLGEAQTIILNGPRILLSEMWNRCQQHASYDIFMQCGDDIIFRTPRWDTRVAETFARYDDKIVFVHCNAKDWGPNLGTHGFLHRRWVDTVGYFVPPYFTSDYNDKWLTELAQMINRHEYLEDVITEHMHPIWGKASWDSTYTERLNRHNSGDLEALYRSLEPQRQADAAKLTAVMR